MNAPLDAKLARPALAVRVARKLYPDPAGGAAQAVLEAVAFELPQRQWCCLVGPSGCGKTTLLNLVAGLDRNFDGAVSIDGAGPQEVPLGYMFQTPRLMPWLSVAENIALALPDNAEAAARVAALLDEMGLQRLAPAFPHQLSGGMQRQVALARAFITAPRLLLMDEPFLSLDAPAAARLRRQALALWQRQPTTVLFVTHDLREALYLGDRILFLSGRPGRVVLDWPVPLARPRTPDGAEIEELRRHLLARHPDLLAGLLGTEPSSGEGERDG